MNGSFMVHTTRGSHVSAAHEADNLPRPLRGREPSPRRAVELASNVRWRSPLASLTRVSFPGWPYFGRTTALNAAIYGQMMISIPASRTGIRAGAGCLRKFLRIKSLTNLLARLIRRAQGFPPRTGTGTSPTGITRSASLASVSPRVPGAVAASFSLGTGANLIALVRALRMAMFHRWATAARQCACRSRRSSLSATGPSLARPCPFCTFPPLASRARLSSRSRSASPASLQARGTGSRCTGSGGRSAS